jgi:hypothetical protein
VSRKKRNIRSAAQAVPLVASLIGAMAFADDAHAQLAPGTPVTDDKVRTDNAPTGQPTVQSALEFHPAAAPSMKDVDSTKVPSPYVAPANHEAYLALEAKMTGDVSKALDTMGLSGDQRIMVRNYMGQFDADNHVVSTGFVNGVQTFGIQKKDSGEFVGQVVLRHADNGAVEVDKVYAAEFETSGKVEVALPTKMLPDDVKKALGSSEETYSLSKDAADGKIELSMPRIKAKAGVDFGLARQSTAVFDADGSGKELVFTTKIASANGPEAELAVTYFGTPKVSADGELTHSEYGAKLEAHGTLANVEGKLGCDEENCSAHASAGILGIGAGAELTLSPAKHVAFDESVGEEHHASAAEEAAFRQATASGTPEALQKFVSEFPNGEHMDEVVNLMDLGAAGTPPDPDPVPDKNGTGRKGY